MWPPLSDQVSPGYYPFLRENLYNEPLVHTSTGFTTEGLTPIHETLSKDYLEERGQIFPLKHFIKDTNHMTTAVDACQLFREPHRVSHPDHIVVILQGLPGSGKSYLAKALRDLEVENGGKAPPIHAMDDYSMIEVEKKVEDNEVSKFSGSSRGKKQISKKVIKYCYEPEMQEAYRSSMLKAFKKTMDEGIFTFIIVDDRNLRLADFARFWAVAKRSGYEVYLLEAAYKDPMGCAARNVHCFMVDDIQQMAEQREEASSLYLKLDIQVDKETDEAPYDEVGTLKLQEKEDAKAAEEKSLDYSGVGGVFESWF